MSRMTRTIFDLRPLAQPHKALIGIRNVNSALWPWVAFEIGNSENWSSLLDFQCTHTFSDLVSVICNDCIYWTQCACYVRKCRGNITKNIHYDYMNWTYLKQEINCHQIWLQLNVTDYLILMSKDNIDFLTKMSYFGHIPSSCIDDFWSLRC